MHHRSTTEDNLDDFSDSHDSISDSDTDCNTSNIQNNSSISAMSEMRDGHNAFNRHKYTADKQHRSESVSSMTDFTYYEPAKKHKKDKPVCDDDSSDSCETTICKPECKKIHPRS